MNSAKFFKLKFLLWGCVFIIAFLLLSFKKIWGEDNCYLPSSINNFVSMGQCRTAIGDDLYYIIDGEASLYIRYKYKYFAIQKYVHEGCVLEVSLAKLKSPRYAFGLYSNYIGKEGKYVGVGSSGFLDDYSLIFYKGAYFVRILLLKGNPSETLLLKFAKTIDKSIKDNRCVHILHVFPKHHIIEHTLIYYPDTVLGYKFPQGGFEVYYLINGKKIKFFLTKGKNEEEIKHLLNIMKEKGIYIERFDMYILGWHSSNTNINNRDREDIKNILNTIKIHLRLYRKESF